MSKKFILSLVAAIAIIAIGLLAASKNDSANTVAEVNDVVTVQTSNSPAAEDTDGDGLKDWEEALWGTNKEDADTDKDGTTDNEELKLGRNPIIPGPGDLLTKDDYKTTEEDGYFYEDDETLTTSDILSRDIIAQYISDRNKEGYDHEATLAKIEGRLESDLLTKHVPEYTKDYEIGDLSLLTENTVESYTTYANDLATILLKYVELAEGKHEIEIATVALENQNQDLMDKLDPMITLYEIMSAELATVPVPSDLSLIHLTIVNDYSLYGKITANFKLIMIDPMKYILSFAQHNELTRDLTVTLEELGEKLMAKGVILTPDDPGSILLLPTPTEN